MPLSRKIIEQLAAITAPVIHHMVPRVAIALPQLAGTDLASVVTWWTSLSDPQTKALLAEMTSGLAEDARRELSTTAAPASNVPPAIPREPDLETLRGDPHVDREPIWDGLQALLTSERRILHVRGDDKAGKSRTVDLVKMFVGLDPQQRHVVIEINLDGLTFDQAMRDVFMSFTDETVPARADVNSTDEPWLKLVAKAAHKRSLALQNQPIPWFVFDHVERLRDFYDHRTFFSRLVELVVETRREPNAPRVVLVDRREVTVNKALYWPVFVGPLTEGDIAKYLRRKNPALDKQAADALAVVLMARARDASTDKPALYMDYLKEELADA